MIVSCEIQAQYEKIFGDIFPNTWNCQILFLHNFMDLREVAKLGYYSKRINKTRKSFIKASIAVDSDKLIIMGWKFSKVPVHDSQYARSLVNQVQKITKSECYTMDKGYDSEKIHEYIRESIKAESIILVRKWNGNIYSGKYRLEMFRDFDKEKYGQRNMVETVFSMIKRRYGDTVRSRKYYNQTKEIKIRMILHNMNL